MSTLRKSAHMTGWGTGVAFVSWLIDVLCDHSVAHAAEGMPHQFKVCAFGFVLGAMCVWLVLDLRNKVGQTDVVGADAGSSDVVENSGCDNANAKPEDGLNA